MCNILQITTVFSKPNLPAAKLLFIHHRSWWFVFVSISCHFMKETTFPFRMEMHLEIWIKMKDHYLIILLSVVLVSEDIGTEGPDFM